MKAHGPPADTGGEVSDRGTNSRRRDLKSRFPLDNGGGSGITAR